MKNLLILLLFCCLLLAGCDDFEYHLIAKGEVVRIEIIGGGFMSSSKRVFYLDEGFVYVSEPAGSYTSIKVGDYIYIYWRDWDGKKIRCKPLNLKGETQ